MRKIPSLFRRDFDGDPSLVTRDVTPGCEWVLEGKGFPTEKFDGMACKVVRPAGNDPMANEYWFKRYDCKVGRIPPPDFSPAQEPDMESGHWPGWVPVKDNNPEDKYIREAIEFGIFGRNELPVNQTWWTYELIGKRIQKNAYNLDFHYLQRHGSLVLDHVPRTFDGLAKYLSKMYLEGIVFWEDLSYPESRKAKIKARDFGIAWPR